MSIYADILEDVKKSDSIIEQTDRIYRTDDAEIYAGFSNTSNIYNIKTKDPEKWILPSESTLRVVFQLTKADGAGAYEADHDEQNNAFAEADIATLICGGLHLFEQARLIIDDNQVELVQKPGFNQLIQTLLTSNIGQLKSMQEGEWLHLDAGQLTTGAFTDPVLTTLAYSSRGSEGDGTDATVRMYAGLADATKYLDRAGNAEDMATGLNPRYNSGFRARLFRTLGQKSVELCIPLTHIFAFFADIRNAYRGIQFEIELTKNTAYSEIIHGRGAYAVVGPSFPVPVAPNVFGMNFHAASMIANTLIKKIEWHMPTLVPNPLLLNKLQEDLQSGDRIPKAFHNSTVYTQQFQPIGGVNGTESYDMDWRVQSTGKKIVQVVVGFQRLPQYSSQNDPDSYVAGPPVIRPTGLNHANGGVFSTLTDINSVELRFGSTILPKERYQRLSFGSAAPNYTRPYVDFLQAGGKWLDDDGGLVSYDSYGTLYPLFAFDLSQMDLNGGNTTTEDLRILATVKPIQLTAGVFTDPEAFRCVALVTYESHVNFYGVDGRLAVELPS